MGEFTNTLKSCVPPAFISLFRHVKPYPYGFSGDYATFEAAAAQCGDGYSSEEVVRKSLERAKTLQREAPIADSVEPHTLRLLGVLHALLKPQTQLRVLDFGGGLGTHYFRLRHLLPKGLNVRWTVCETKVMADAGSKNFSNEELRFVDSLEALNGETFDCVIASGSLQYVSEPERVLQQLSKYSSTVVIDRVPLQQSGKSRVTIQKIPPSIFKASYPAWFFDEEMWVRTLKKFADISMTWTCPEDSVFIDGTALSTKGYALVRR